MDLELLAALNRERKARRAVLTVMDVTSGEHRLLREQDLDAEPLGDLLRERLRSGRSGMLDASPGSLFITVHRPPTRLILVGAVHVSQALSPMARMAGLDVTVIDPRTAFATPERFPDSAVVAEWPDEVLPRLALDRFTGLAALTHDPKIDDPALRSALAGECFYIGALGSRRTHARRCERLQEMGFSEGMVARVHAPIGIDIGAVSPAEIAVSILAEVIQAMRRKPPRPEGP